VYSFLSNNGSVSSHRFLFSQNGKGGMMSGMMGMMSGFGKGNDDDDYGVSWNTCFPESTKSLFLTDQP
jgi:hypothetical protein